MARSNKLMPYSGYLHIFLAFIFYFTLERDYFLSIIDSWLEISAFWTCMPVECHLDKGNRARKEEKCILSYWNTNIKKLFT